MTQRAPKGAMGTKPPGIKQELTTHALAPAPLNLPAPPSAVTLPAGPRPQRGAGRLRWGKRERLGAAGGRCYGNRQRLPGHCRPGVCLSACGAMGNCHTVGPNEALVVSGEATVRAGKQGRPAEGARP